jgi:hypothetical protein
VRTPRSLAQTNAQSVRSSVVSRAPHASATAATNAAPLKVDRMLSGWMLGRSTTSWAISTSALSCTVSSRLSRSRLAWVLNLVCVFDHPVGRSEAACQSSCNVASIYLFAPCSTHASATVTKQQHKRRGCFNCYRCSATTQGRRVLQVLRLLSNHPRATSASTARCSAAWPCGHVTVRQ